MICCVYQSPTGPLRIVSDGISLVGLYYSDSEPAADAICESDSGSVQAIRDTKRWLDMYFGGKVPDFTPRLFMKGTNFQKEVWDILLTIPYGQTVSYNAIAEKIAKRRGIPRMSAQAVGNAVGKNPISIIVPCHRVIGSDGSLTGYAGGLDRKRFLLSLEKQVLHETL